MKICTKVGLSSVINGIAWRKHISQPEFRFLRYRDFLYFPLVNPLLFTKGKALENSNVLKIDGKVSIQRSPCYTVYHTSNDDLCTNFGVLTLNFDFCNF